MSLKVHRYENVQSYIDEQFGDILEDGDSDSEAEINKAKAGLNAKYVTVQTTDLLASLQSGCGGTMNMFPISKEDSISLQCNQDATNWLEMHVSKDRKADYHHDTDWSDLECSICVIGSQHFIVSFMHG